MRISTQSTSTHWRKTKCNNENIGQRKRCKHFVDVSVTVATITNTLAICAVKCWMKFMQATMPRKGHFISTFMILEVIYKFLNAYFRQTTSPREIERLRSSKHVEINLQTPHFDWLAKYYHQQLQKANSNHSFSHFSEPEEVWFCKGVISTDNNKYGARKFYLFFIVSFYSNTARHSVF